MTAAIVLGVLAFFVVLLVVSRATKRRRDEARASLEAEKKSLEQRSIMDLVHEEAEELGLADVTGADAISVVVQLKVWHRDAHVRAACPDPSLLRYVVDEDAPAEPEAEHVRLDFEGYEEPTTPS